MGYFRVHLTRGVKVIRVDRITRRMVVVGLRSVHFGVGETGIRCHSILIQEIVWVGDIGIGARILGRIGTLVACRRITILKIGIVLVVRRVAWGIIVWGIVWRST